MPAETAEVARAWLTALTGEEGAEVDMALAATLDWLGVPPPTAAWAEDPHYHHHH